MYQKSFAALALVLAFSFVTAAQEAGDRATVQMRDGTRVEGRIEELAGGTLFLRVALHDQRREPRGPRYRAGPTHHPSCRSGRCPQH